MTRSMRLLLILVIMCGCVGCDQATKLAARQHLPDATRISLLHDTVRLERAANVGAFLSLGASLPRALRSALFSIGGVLIVSLGVLWALFRCEASLSQAVAITLASAGGLSNVIDRLSRGYVTDFLNVGIGSMRTGIFNVADMALMVGLGLLLATSLRRKA